MLPCQQVGAVLVLLLPPLQVKEADIVRAAAQQPGLLIHRQEVLQ
jgi:hypothetical protein